LWGGKRIGKAEISSKKWKGGDLEGHRSDVSGSGLREKTPQEKAEMPSDPPPRRPRKDIHGVV